MRRSLKMCRECPRRRCDPDLGAWTPSSCRHRGRRHAFSRPSTWRPGSAFCSSSSAASRQGPSRWQSGCRLRQAQERSSSRSQRTGITRSFLLEHPAKRSEEANADRESDLSAKRNIGLLLARLHGWNKIVFVDDDVTLSRTDNVARLAGQLDRYQVAGMIVRDYPDNSVVCHARRDAGLPQDVFLTGAVLGVHCNNLPLSFFPDIYNEDWFFFAREAASRELRGVGQASQLDVRPVCQS